MCLSVVWPMMEKVTPYPLETSSCMAQESPLKIRLAHTGSNAAAECQSMFVHGMSHCTVKDVGAKMLIT